MACIPTPTKTEYTTLASTSTLTTLTDSVVTEPPLVTSIITQSCSQMVLGPGRTSCINERVTEVTTIRGEKTTVQVPIVIVFQITQASPTRTLFVSCSSTSSEQSDTSSGSPTTPITSSSTSTALITTTVTPAPTVIVSEQTSTLSDGEIVVDTTTLTSTFAPIPVVIPAIPSSSPSPAPGAESVPSSASAIGPIIGGSLGGFFGLIGIVFLMWWIWKKRRKWLPASLVSEKSNHPILPPGYVVEPQQYQYGHVGSMISRAPSVYARSSNSHSHTLSHAHSIGHSGTPPSMTGASSQWQSVRQNSSPTPPFFAGTAILPGPSDGPSSANLHSGSSTPGQAFQNPPPSAFLARPGRSGYGSGTDDEQSSEGHGSITFLARRPSRHHSPTIERRSGLQSSERRLPQSFERKSSPPKSRKSFSGAIEIERPVRPNVLRRRSTDATPVYEEPRSPLFVVNHTEEPSGSDAEVDPPEPT